MTQEQERDAVRSGNVLVAGRGIDAGAGVLPYGGERGLPEAAGPAGAVAFAGPDRGVSVNALATDGKTEVTILNREYDYWAERFLPERK